MRLIADSGSSKTEWRLILPNGKIESLSTDGINPSIRGSEDIALSLNSVLSHFDIVNRGGSISLKSICLYSAGAVGGESTELLKEMIVSLFGEIELFVYSDLLAAARALYRDRSGVVAILGTGSNSGYYDGDSIVSSISSGGFILGDEGGGAALGRRLIADFIKGMLPDDITDNFSNRYGELSYGEIVDRVYRSKSPNKFLGSFVEFLIENLDNKYVYDLICLSFSEFFERSAARYGDERDVAFVGSIAYVFRDILCEVANRFNMRVVKIVKSPVDELVSYHILFDK